ncbi:hypothetical protein SPAB_00689 [Salmonella enterica subsp. enterica serovar Paratyphi B str. SPB7]|uniref:Uncharacterized protein n=1 Tax=Salmonella paratyphi B (strain ATCC BAA-1250 / SPB7) TaxID=1016998 RepID=A0A6C6YZA1_SALPB|nr:hypothetical protein SPAB_00689 [Salmonella enterica subsp. enterica serovar Paratyphi B str. SPB7]
MFSCSYDENTITQRGIGRGKKNDGKRRNMARRLPRR